MRTLQLLGVAAEAESLRLRREAARVARRAGWVLAAAMFGAAGLAAAHVAAVTALEPRFGLAGAAGLVALADLALAALLALASRLRRDPVAEEALALRRTAMAAVAARSPLQDALGAAAGQALARWIDRNV